MKKLYKLVNCLILKIALSTSAALVPCQADASDKNGVFSAHSSVSCGNFLQSFKDEEAARAMLLNPRNDYYYNHIYASHAWYVFGIITGVNARVAGVKNVLPFDSVSILFLVKKRCELVPTDALAVAVLSVIEDSRGHWQ